MFYWLPNYRWYRRFWGGHWEQWWFFPGDFPIWIQVDDCYHDTGKRPGGCSGEPNCEDYYDV